MNKNKIRKVIFLLIFTAGFLITPLKSPVYAASCSVDTSSSRVDISGLAVGNYYYARINPPSGSFKSLYCGKTESSDLSIALNPNDIKAAGHYTVEVFDGEFSGVFRKKCHIKRPKNNIANCFFNKADITPAGGRIEAKEICKQIGDQCKKLPPSKQQGCQERTQKCEECFKAQGGAYTAIGCIPIDASGFVGWLLGPLIGIAGGIAFLLILGGGFSILFSQGNPETIAAGKERITAAILGLLVIIFSVLILRVIGVDILRLPGFQP